LARFFSALLRSREPNQSEKTETAAADSVTEDAAEFTAEQVSTWFKNKRAADRETARDSAVQKVNPHMSVEQQKRMASCLALSEEQVLQWFGDRRERSMNEEQKNDEEEEDGTQDED
ncbi:hypothetical protein PMAYCL1PPCAC_28299, partial [Pristionchus mayeri]